MIGKNCEETIRRFTDIKAIADITCVTDIMNITVIKAVMDITGITVIKLFIPLLSRTSVNKTIKDIIDVKNIMDLL